VESKDPQTEPGEGGAPTDNVVRLPRDWRGPKDWLDPRDELVPVGPPASAPAEADTLPPAPSDAESSPLGADAFWSEGSAAIQDAVRAPSWGVAWGQDGAEDAPGRTKPVQHGVPSRRVLLGACATAVLALAGVIGALDSTPPASNGRGLAVAEHHAQVNAPRKTNASASAHLLKRPDRGARATTIRRERASSHVTVAHSRANRSHPRSAAAVPTQRVSVTRSVSQSQTPPAAASTDAATASGKSAASSSSSGPVGAGAAFGPGHLGS
jgi:hypothetical protein